MQFYKFVEKFSISLGTGTTAEEEAITTAQETWKLWYDSISKKS